MHVKLTNGQNPQHYSLLQLRADYPDEDFPTLPADDLLVAYEVYPYVMDDMPDFDEDVETVQLGAFRQDGVVWRRGWLVVDIPDEDAARNKRFARAALLAQSDWTQLLDAPVDRAVWAAYRQALRDVPQQSGFPRNIIGPAAPQ